MLVDWQIASLQARSRVVEPYLGMLTRETEDGRYVIPWGLAEAGYVLRLGTGGRAYPIANDPKAALSLGEVAPADRIEPGTVMLAFTREGVFIPRGYRGSLELIPEYVRCGLRVTPTLMWRAERERGPIEFELINPGPERVRLYRNEGIVRLVLEQFEFDPKGIAG